MRAFCRGHLAAVQLLELSIAAALLFIPYGTFFFLLHSHHLGFFHRCLFNLSGRGVAYGFGAEYFGHRLLSFPGLFRLFFLPPRFYQFRELDQRLTLFPRPLFWRRALGLAVLGEGIAGEYHQAAKAG